MAIPILFKINDKHLIEIMLSSTELAVYEAKLGNKPFANWTDEEILQCSVEACVYPTEVTVDAEQYSKNAERTANYVLEDLTIVNCKSKVTFVWSYLKASYLSNLLTELEFDYDFEINDIVYSKTPNIITVTYWDFIGVRTINAYMGQSISGNLIQYDDYDTSTWNSSTKQWNKNTSTLHKGATLYWESLRLAFIER